MFPHVRTRTLITRNVAPKNGLLNNLGSYLQSAIKSDETYKALELGGTDADRLSWVSRREMKR